MNFTHIINPVKVHSTSDLYFAQPITFQTMRIAQTYSYKFSSNLNINTIATCYPEDRGIVPDSLSISEFLKCSVLDIESFRVPRKLPFIKDILDIGFRYEEKTDYLIYSNSDIALMPYFYEYVYDMVSKGFDGLIINRRTISDQYRRVDEIPEMLAQIGTPHPGYDCFVIKTEYYPRFILGKMIIGTARVGLALYLNMRCMCQEFSEVGDSHLTFHIGDEQPWKESKLEDYKEFNKKELAKVVRYLSEKHGDVTRYIEEAFPQKRREKKL